MLQKLASSIVALFGKNDPLSKNHVRAGAAPSLLELLREKQLDSLAKMKGAHPDFSGDLYAYDPDALLSLMVELSYYNINNKYLVGLLDIYKRFVTKDVCVGRERLFEPEYRMRMELLSEVILGGYLRETDFRDIVNGARIAYAQEGEDLILEKIFYNRAQGFYVDVGAHHPVRYSNTYLFYQKGWRGINLDPVPGMKYVFDELRPGDVNLELAVSDEKGQVEYFIFEESALNTCSSQLSDYYVKEKGAKLLRTEVITFVRLSDILNEYAHQQIEFLSIDTEGYELAVLNSNDWDKFRPLYILVELLREDILGEVTQVLGFLQDKGYSLFANTRSTGFFKRNDIQ